jgi:hypothetical protein
MQMTTFLTISTILNAILLGLILVLIFWWLWAQYRVIPYLEGLTDQQKAALTHQVIASAGLPVLSIIAVILLISIGLRPWIIGSLFTGALILVSFVAISAIKNQVLIVRTGKPLQGMLAVLYGVLILGVLLTIGSALFTVWFR